MPPMKTPGVYIVEKNAFPNSVVEVATAVPGFVGYTEKASNKGTPLTGKPFRISTMAEFEQYFGGKPRTVFQIQKPGPVNKGSDVLEDADFSINALAAEVAEARSAVARAIAAAPNAAEALQKANADIQAAQGPANSAKSALTSATSADAQAKEAVIAAQDALDKAAAAKKAELTTQLEAAKATAAEKAALLATATANANETKRILDDAQKAKATAEFTPEAAQTAADAAASKAANSSTEARTNYVLKDTGRWRLWYAMRHFFLNGGGPCWIVSVGDYASPDADLKKLMAGVDFLQLELEPTMVVIPDAVRLAEQDCISLQQHMLLHCGQVMKNRFAILDIWNGDKDANSGDPVGKFRSALGVNDLKFGAAYYPWVNTTLVQDRDVSYLDFEGGDASLADLLFSEVATTKDKPAGIDAVMVDVARDDANWLTEAGKYWDANSKPKLEPGKDPVTERAAWLVSGAPDWVKLRKEQTNETLFRVSNLYVTIARQTAKRLNLLPPAAAMAGVYTSVDNARGVWKAPANVSLNSVVSPAVPISNAQQEDLNVTATGKSINAIRSFIGEGVLVWGARTLDGNSLDWRYINVRRTMIMLEESCRLAAKATVFEPNVAGTWVTIRSMIENFLTGIWKRGGLAGAVPEDAFSVHVGLGETMTPEDILEGILRVTVLVAISRPAEFIEITFQQQMQKS